MLWTPPGSRDPRVLADQVADQLRGYGARPWQVALTTPLVVDAVIEADRTPAQAEGVDDGPDTHADAGADAGADTAHDTEAAEPTG